MTTKISQANIQASTLENLGGSPTITAVQICDSSYVTLDDTAVALTGGYIRVLGTRFASGCQVLIDQVAATAVTFISSTELRVQVPALSAGTYILYVTNTDGSTAIRVNGLTASATPSWVTASTLPEGASGTAISIQLVASLATTYALAAGSTLPAGLTLSSSGLLSGTITISTETTYNFSIVATDPELQDSPRSFSVNITVGDLYFPYVTTLLSPQVSTPFVADTSTSNFPISVIGDTRPNNFGPYTPGYYSFNFSAKTQYVSTPATTALTTFTSDFTFEAWINPTDTSITYWGIWDSRQTGGTAQAMIFMLEPLASAVSGQGRLKYYNGTNYYSTGIVYYNTWTHVALVRSGTTVTFYVNGVASGTATVSGTQTGTATTNPVWIGTKDNANANYGSIGYISNLRVVNGTAVYTANFTPSTAPLTAITNTVLLTAQSNRFLDNSTNNYTLTSSSALISGFDPFLSSSTHTGRGSGYFDGTGDYLSVPYTTSFLPASGVNFTAECWVYITGATAVFSHILGMNSSTVNNWFIKNENGVLQGGIGSINGNFGSAVANTWIHLALVQNNNTLYGYINGVQAFTGAITSWNTNNLPLTIGARSAPDRYFTGHISNVRVVNGTAVYTAAFTPPTEPLTAVTNTSLLTLQSNQPVSNNTFVDSSSSNFLVTRAGNTTQGTYSPYGGGWSNYFDGTGDYLSVALATGAYSLGTADFTVEMWVNLPSYITTTNSTVFIAGGSNSLSISLDTTGKLRSSQWGGANIVTSANTIALNQWVHIAVTRQGTTVRHFINGVLDGSGTSSATLTGLSATQIGQDPGASANTYTGYISNLRVVKGTALYTANFTPPTDPLLPVTGTSLLTCADNRFLDDSLNNFAITRAGDVSVQKFSPFGIRTATAPQTYSAYFDGTGDTLNLPSSTALLAAGNYTVEFWVNMPTAPTGGAYHTCFAYGSTGAVLRCFVLDESGTKLGVWIGATNVIRYLTTAMINSWAHIALVRLGTTLTIYINGISIATYTDSTDYNTGQLYIGSQTSTNYLTGFISNFRIVTGTALYTTNFTPPTSPLTAVANTTLLTCQSDKFVDASTNKFPITATGDAKPSQINPFGYIAGAKTAYTPQIYGGSMYFDGAGDYLDLPNNTIFSQTGSWTLELWVYPTATANNYVYSQVTSNFLQINISATNFVLIDRSGVGNLITSTNALLLNTWTHIALVSDGTNMKLYINGTQSGSTAAVGTQAASAATTRIGAYQSNGTLPYKGYISNLRLVKGTAVYTSNFVPPAAPVTPITNTALLLSDTAAVYDSSTGNVLETVGDAKLSTAVVKYGNTSIYFDGTGDYLTIPNNPSLDLGASNFTVEMWVYRTIAGNFTLFAKSGSYELKTDTDRWVWQVNTSNNAFVTSGTLTLNTWVHVALVRNGATTTLYINGSAFTSGASTNATSNTNPIQIGFGPGGTALGGYISDFRFTKGIARYTANFTPPASLVQAK